MADSLWAFVLIPTAVIVTPGPDTAVTIRSTLLGGRNGGLATALGVACGQTVWALATSAGLVAVLLASEPIFNTLKLAGAAYLVWLGVQTIWYAWRGGEQGATSLQPPSAPRLTAMSAFRHGLISDLGNPKMAMFFASVLPQFATPGEGMMSSLALFGFLFAAMTLTWLALYAVFVAAAGSVWRSTVGRMIEGVMGATLIALGARVACEQK